MSNMISSGYILLLIDRVAFLSFNRIVISSLESLLNSNYLPLSFRNNLLLFLGVFRVSDI